jgi:hypothetical protein
LHVRGARCLVFKFMDLFDTALQVHGPMVYLTLVYIYEGGVRLGGQLS